MGTRRLVVEEWSPDRDTARASMRLDVPTSGSQVFRQLLVD
jgi:hypothetical protein